MLEAFVRTVDTGIKQLKKQLQVTFLATNGRLGVVKKFILFKTCDEKILVIRVKCTSN